MAGGSDEKSGGFGISVGNGVAFEFMSAFISASTSEPTPAVREFCKLEIKVDWVVTLERAEPMVEAAVSRLARAIP